MKTYRILLVLFLSALWSCQSAEDISYGLDHEVPMITFSADRAEADRGSEHRQTLTVVDNVGLASLVVSYPNWDVQQTVELNGEGTFTTAITIKVPDDALLEWNEVKYGHDGSSYTAREQYHKFTVISYDVNQNKRTSYSYIKVR